MGILFALLFSLIIGSIACLIMPGKQSFNWIQTIFLGMVGCSVGGVISLLLGLGYNWTILGGIIGTLIVLFALTQLVKE